MTTVDAVRSCSWREEVDLLRGILTCARMVVEDDTWRPEALLRAYTRLQSPISALMISIGNVYTYRWVRHGANNGHERGINQWLLSPVHAGHVIR